MDTSKRIYLDYNATTPLCGDFIVALGRGDIPYANPSSQHTSGKQSHKYTEQVKSYLFDYFGLSKHEYEILFHSGASEASNTFLAKGDEKFLFFNSDHACVTSLANNKNSFMLDPLANGQMNIEDVVRHIKEQNCSWMHFTQVHNETGVVWPLEIAQKIKEQTNCKIYVDAVQAPGKIKNFQNLISGIDVYTYSGHKFGALKGIGFSFYKKDLVFSPLVKGGGQQLGKRAGTVNVQGIASLKFALDNVTLNEDLKALKEEIIKILEVNSKIQVISNDSYNTICFVHAYLKSDILLIHFDLAGLDVSSGSACSSGSMSESKTLKAMGYGDLASHNIRISLGPENLLHKDTIISKLKQVMEKL